MDIEIDPQAQTVIFRGDGQAEQHYHCGDVIGGSYQLLELIGQGGMGVVYRVKHLILEKQFALKLLAPNQINNQNWRRFELEGRSLAKLNHTNIVSISNMGIDKGCPYFVMDLLTGISLAEQIKNCGPLSEKENLDIYMQVCAGLSCAHRNGIIHRDIKPGNIMLLPSEKGFLVKIVDFGLVRLQSTGSATSQALTASGEVFGSPYYMSPEQTVGEEIDARSDIYSLGCSLFESLTGQVPFAGASAIQTLMMHQEAEAPIPSSRVANRKISPALDQVVARCLKKDAKLRYQSADQLAIDLQRIAEGKPIGSGALDYQGLKQSSEKRKARKARIDHFEDDEEDDEEVDDDDDNQANEQNHSNNFFSSHKLALSLTSITSIILVAAACFTLSNKASPQKKPLILKDTTQVSLGIEDDEVAFKMNDAARGFRETATPDSTEDSSEKDGEQGSETLTLVAEHAAKGRTAEGQIAAIENGPKFSRGVKTINGHLMRCFKFPSKQSIGKLRFTKRHVEAQGEVLVPENADIDLHLRHVAAQNAVVIDKFRADDISTLRLEESNSVGEFTRRLSKWTKLHGLTIEGGKINDADLVTLDSIKQLHFLWLKRLSFSAEMFAKLNVLKRLQVLQIEDCEQLNQIVQSLPVMPELATMRLEGRGDHWLDGRSIAALAKQPKLRTLELKSKDGLTLYPATENFAPKNGRPQHKLPIYDCRHELAELRNVELLILEKPNWTREQLEDFLLVVPKARANSWARNKNGN